MKMYSEKPMASKKKSMGKERGEMGYAGSVEKINPAPMADMGKVKPMPIPNKGYPNKAWEYKY